MTVPLKIESTFVPLIQAMTDNAVVEVQCLCTSEGCHARGVGVPTDLEVAVMGDYGELCISVGEHAFWSGYEHEVIWPTQLTES
jgi:hypothetical protein